MVTVIHLEEEIFDKTTQQKLENWGYHCLKLPSYIMITQQKDQNPNSVKGNAKSSSRTSPGGRLSTQQATLDRHPATACTTREKMKIATWNARTMYQAGKLENIVLETKRMGIDIMGLAEDRWLQSGKIV